MDPVIARSRVRGRGNPICIAQPTLCAAFQCTLRTKTDATRITWREYGERVRAYASGFAGLGVCAGDTLAVLLSNRPELNLVDTAAIHLGAVPFSIDLTSTVEQIRYLLADPGARVAVTQAALLPRLREAATGTGVERIVVVDAEADGTLTLAGLAAAAPAGFDLEATWRAVSPEAWSSPTRT